MEELTYMKELFLEFIDDLKVVLTQPRELIELTLIEVYFKTTSRNEIMQDVIEKVLPQKNVIKRRDINYFSDNRSLFAGLPEDRIHYYGDIIINSNRLTEDDKQAIWAYLDRIIDTAEAYKKNV